LLLIVSGSNEITLDEIGEINDHIQTEAGHNANIMGVGEDETLRSIAVTIIATGFDIEQNGIKKKKEPIHTLEDEQRSVHNLMGFLHFDCIMNLQNRILKESFLNY
jgi:cell division protein FtsZ